MAGQVVSLHIGEPNVFEKRETERLELALDGIVGDRHRGIQRIAYDGDKQPKGTPRRNERMWSAIAAEDLTAMTEAMNLAEPLTAAHIGVNFCFSGIADLSRLPRGTTLTFPSGAQLMVEEYNPPCTDMSEHLAQTLSTRDGAAPANNAFSQAAKFSRGLVGVVEVAGEVARGDAVEVAAEKLPKWLRPS